jgi:hypothetical protein
MSNLPPAKLKAQDQTGEVDRVGRGVAAVL